MSVVVFVIFVSDCVYVHNGARFCEQVVKEAYESRSSVNYEVPYPKPYS